MRRLVFIYMVFFAAFFAFSPQGNASEGNAQAQAYVMQLSEEAITFISDNSLSEEDKREAFRNWLIQYFDLEKIARFSVGQYWRTASPDDHARFRPLFEDMIVDMYANRFSEYSNEKIIVDGARFDGQKDYFVFSHIVPPTGPKIKVDWRLRDENKRFRVIDVIVEGVSMSVTQRADFAAIIRRNGGTLQALISHIENQ